MATHEPRSSAQDVVSCDFCKNPTQQFCNSCQVKLCKECVPKHVDNTKSMSHDIVRFRNRKIQPVFTECEFHEGQKCEAQCQKCHIPICIKCCIGPHKNHEAVDIAELVERKKQEIQNDTEEIEDNIIPNYTKAGADLPEKLRKITTEITKAEEETEKLRKLWHQEVDDIFNKLASVFAGAKDRNSEILKNQQMKMKTGIQSMTQILERNKDILKNNKASNFTDYKSELDCYRGIHRDIDFTKPILKATTLKGMKMSIGVGKCYATLTFSPLCSPSTDASDRTNRAQFNSVLGRPVQNMINQDKYQQFNEFLFRKKGDNVRGEFELEREKNFFSGSK